MRIKPCVFVIGLLFPLSSPANSPTRHITRGLCKLAEVQVTYSDTSVANFPLRQGYKCSDLKISEDRKAVGWKMTGELLSESAVEKRTFQDALLSVLTNGKVLTVIENARFIPNWFFVPRKQNVIVETAFEHGPSTYVLYDLEKNKVIGTFEEAALMNRTDLATLFFPGRSRK